MSDDYIPFEQFRSRPKEVFEVGDDAWIWLSHHNGEMTKGKVVAFLDLPGYSFRHYVIEVDTHIDPLLEIRCPPFAMRKTPPKGQALYRNIPAH